MSTESHHPVEYSYAIRKNFNNFYDLKQKLLNLSCQILTEIKTCTNLQLKKLEDLYNANVLLRDPRDIKLDPTEVILNIKKFYDEHFGFQLKLENFEGYKKKDEFKVKNQEFPKPPKEVKVVNETQIFISGLPLMCTNEDLHKLFQHCGEIVTTSVPPGEGQSRNFGFVTFMTVEATQEALKMNGMMYMGRPLKVQLSKQKSDSSRKVDNKTTVFVGNLSFYTTETTLIDFFKTVGEAKTVRIARDSNGNVRGFAHVEFYFPHQAYAALKLNETTLNGRPIRIELAGGGKKLQESINSMYYQRPGPTNVMPYGQYPYNNYF